MAKIILLALVAVQLTGCCGSLKHAIRAHGASLEDAADTTTELVKRCKQGDGAACDQALKSLAVQKTAAGQLKTIN
jgi:hypothetical protein